MAKKNKNKKHWFSRLVDMEDNSVSASTVFLVITSIVAIILLLVPAIALLIEVLYNHTISTDLSGMAAYIGAVATIFASGGILKGWTNYSNYKFLSKNGNAKKVVETIKEQITENTASDELSENTDTDISQEDNG